jgi:AcrR family transcriptional regulator
MDIRDRILDAAKKVYAQHGFRGATTRLIAIEAGVNEVTLFRTFGSKAALFEALMQAHVAASPIPDLPDIPVDAPT